MDTDTDQVPRYSDPAVMGVYNSYIPQLGGHASQLALNDAVIDGPFGYQLVHGDPEIDTYLRRELVRNDPTASYPNYISNPTPGLVFIPSASSSGWLVSGLPIETAAAINLGSARDKMWMRYGAFGFVERNEALYAAICPADLAGRKCVWDEVWAWDARERKWRGGCQMIRLCERTQSFPRPAAPALTPYQYALHVPTIAHDTLMALHAGSSNATLAIFNPTHPTNTRHMPHPLLGSVSHTSWPVLIPSPLPPTHEAHVFNCTALHGIKRTCYALRSDKATTFAKRKAMHKKHTTTATASKDAAPTCPALLTSGICLYGHDLPTARHASAGAGEKAHFAAAEALVAAGQAVRTQRLTSGRTQVWLRVPGACGPAGEEDRFVIDGEADVRRGWELKHTVPWCRACNPPSVAVAVAMAQQEQQQRQQEDEEGQQAEGVDWGGAQAETAQVGAYYVHRQAEYRYQYQHQHQASTTCEPEYEGVSWADSESTWQEQDNNSEVDEGLMQMWRETMMGKNSK